jgi:hypothetical protein
LVVKTNNPLEERKMRKRIQGLIVLTLFSILLATIVTAAPAITTEQHKKSLTNKINARINFSISASPNSLAVQQGSYNTSTITITSLKGFGEKVYLNVTSPPIDGVETSLYPSEVIPPRGGFAISILTVHVATTAVPGNYNITVTGTGGRCHSPQHSVKIALAIAPILSPLGDFSISASPQLMEVHLSGSNESVIMVTSLKGFDRLVNLTAIMNEPIAGVTVTLTPSQVIPPPNGSAVSLLTVSANATANEGSYTITVNGTSGSLQRSMSILLNIIAPSIIPHPDFLIAAFPDSLTIQVGASDTSTIVVISVRGFNQSVNLTATSEPINNDISISVDPSRVIPPPDDFVTARLIVNVTETVSVGVYAINVTATSGLLEPKSAVIRLEITPLSTIPPTIATVLRNPETPAYNESTTVTAFVYDESGSSIKQVILNYSAGTGWTPVNMTLSDGLYKAVIPSFPFNTTVEYRVLALDEANNLARSNLYSYQVIDPYPPLIGTPSWAPKKPAANVDIQINVTAIKPAYSSGIQNVTLWFKNGTMEEWRLIPMTLKNGNWTAILSNQSNTVVKFFIEAFDRAGNRAETQTYEIQVAGITGFPLAWILIIIIIIAAAIGSAAYLIRRRRSAQKGVGPTPSVKPPSLTVPPPVAPAITPAKKIDDSYGMASFVVPTYNEEDKISQRIADVFEMAAHHKGPSEIIIVDDGSNDNTYEMVSAAVNLNRKKHPRITAKVVRHSARLGKAEAIRTGRNKALGEIVTTVNGNASTFMITI